LFFIDFVDKITENTSLKSVIGLARPVGSSLLRQTDQTIWFFIHQTQSNEAVTFIMCLAAPGHGTITKTVCRF
jgi:hypothetical protein